MEHEPFFGETQTLFRCVNTLDLEGLRAMVDDEYGIVDVDPEGRTVVLGTRAEWDSYMEINFAAMRAAGAELSTEVLEYHGEAAGGLGYSVVRFVQRVEVGGAVTENPCVATIVWKLTDDGWKEARWHCSPEQAGTRGA